MNSSWTFVTLLFLSLQYLACSSQLPDFRYNFCIDTNGNYTNTSAFAANLHTLVTTLDSSSDNLTAGGFFNLTVGTVDKVNSIALCEGDVTPSVCKSCLYNATRKLREKCPNQKEAIGWYNECMFRYSTRSLFNNMETMPGFTAFSLANATDPDTYTDKLSTLLRSLQDTAAAGDSSKKYAQNFSKVNDFENVYAKVECTPDISGSDCWNCIDNIISGVPSCCYGKHGAIIGRPSCVVAYENSRIYNPLPPPVPAPASSPPPSSLTSKLKNTGTTKSTTGKTKNRGKLVIAIAIPAAICTLLFSLMLGWCFLRRTRAETSPDPINKKDDDDNISNVESLQFAFSTIMAATDNFSDANKLGQGGFGAVYKGVLSNGQEIAVKRLATNSNQGETEFKTEVLLVAKLQHRNLVRLIGFCLEGQERLLLYEFVPNTSLDHILFDPVKRGILDWPTRFRIITGIARGLLYLHEDSQLRIIHRDLKASNILLDQHMHPKISDFGTARLFGVDQTQGDTSRIVGTYGYMAPEYAFHGFFSVKSDVYSFGVLILEIITGRKNRDFQNEECTEDLLSFVWRNWRGGTLVNIIDQTMSNVNAFNTDIMRCTHMALLCVQESGEDRPTMSSMVVMLSSQSLTLPVPSQPAFITGTTVKNKSDSNQCNKDLLVAGSVNDDSITEMHPR